MSAENTNKIAFLGVELPTDPWLLFDRWLQQVLTAKLQDPTAMILASVDARGQPFQRTVLLKQVSDQGLVFFYQFKKSQGTAN